MAADKMLLVTVPGKSGDEAASILDEAAAKLNGNTGSPSGESIKSMGEGIGVFEVQYNPGSLKITSQGGSTKRGGLYKGNSKKAESIEQYVNAQETEVTFELHLEGDHVQRTAGGLLGLMAGEPREVMLCWGNINFPGEMSNVSVSFTMFDRTGLPIRGKAQMGIRQKCLTPRQRDYWQQAFRKLL